MSEALSAAELATSLDALPGWTGSTTSMERTVTAPSFPVAIAIVSDVAEAAERANHHPDIDIRWRSVRFGLTTHDAGGVTRRDLGLAAVIDAVAERHGAT